MSEGIATLESGELKIESVTPKIPLLFSESGEKALSPDITKTSRGSKTERELRKELERLKKELNALKIKKVAKQQSDFEGVKK